MRMSAVVDSGLAELVWFGTATLRHRAHAVVGQAHCPTRGVPYAETGGKVHQFCLDVGCLGIMHEIYARSIQRLSDRREAAAPVLDLLGYARRIVSSQVSEYERHGRVRRGLPAKPTRNDGVAARINSALDGQAADDHGRIWLRTLFRMMRGYACRDNRASAVWPLDVWSTEKSTVDGVLRSIGASSTRAELSKDIQLVLATAEKVAGRRWMDDAILHPLQTFVTPLTEDHQRLLAAAQADPADVVSVAELRGRFRSLMLAGASAQEALDRSADEVLGRRPSCEVDEVLDDLLPDAELARIRTIRSRRRAPAERSATRR
ncbi:hypothetical protein ACFPJ1_09285 [Kribbella qitaiheensis]|uniref:hypothetical protein n=1 Tax=Kribbella qitaiheensis TaxID=1544730 RepID=UPI0036220626